MAKAHLITTGSIVAPRALPAVSGELVSVPDDRHLTHLQFRRFAGCPICNLHLQSFARRHGDLDAAGIREVVVFHSSAATLAEHVNDLPFHLIADPSRMLYRAFGVESSLRSLLDPRVWRVIAGGVANSIVEWLTKGHRLPSMNPEGGRLGLPADFLIGRDGEVIACKYGEHAYDQWSVDEVLALASAEGPQVRSVGGPIRQSGRTLMAGHQTG